MTDAGAYRQLPDWENPEVLGRNRRQPHVPLRSFESREQALAWSTLAGGEGCESGRVQSLDGEWDFRLLGSPEELDPGALGEGEGGEWGRITVPGVWERQGYGRPQYLNFTYPIPVDPPAVPRANPTGLYRRPFATPAGLAAGSRSFLTLSGADSCARLWLNGVEVGFSKDSRLPSEWDVTGLLRPAAGGGASVGEGGGDLAGQGAPEGSSDTNWLTIMIPKFSDASYLEDQDMWRMSGLHRSVFLLHKPPACIVNFEADVRLAFDDAPTLTESPERPLLSASLKVTVDLELPEAEEAEGLGGEGRGGKGALGHTRGPTDVADRTQGELERLDAAACSRYRVVAELFRQKRSGVIEAWNRKLPASEASELAHPSHAAWTASASPHPLWRARDGGGLAACRAVRGARATLELGDVLAELGGVGGVSPLLWSPEDPQIFVLVLTLERLGGGSGRESGDTGVVPLEREACQVGFRSTRVVQGVLYHNETPLKVRGANRHEFDPVKGRPPSPSLSLEDACLLKRLNFNAVRLSHYPGEDRWYELCSLVGLLVCDEANVETHGFDPSLRAPERDPAGSGGFFLAILDRVRRAVERDLNHPCISLFSLGNECGYGPAHAAAAAFVRARAPSRLVHYEGGGSRTPATDVICPMYARVAQLSGLVADPSEGRPVLLCEYAHAMGNSGGGLGEYWDAFWTHGRFAGGFVWDWADAALLSLAESCGEGASSPAVGEEGGGTGGPAWGDLTARPGAPDDPLPPPVTRPGVRYLVGGDFGDSPHDGQFCCNGVVGPDRIPHPSGLEIAHLQLPYELDLDGVEATRGRLADSPGGAALAVSLRLRERFGALPLGGSIEARWMLVADGVRLFEPQPLAEGEAETHGLPPRPQPGRWRRFRGLAPPDEALAIAPVRAAALIDPLELEVSFALLDDTLWGRAGYVLGVRRARLSREEARRWFGEGGGRAPGASGPNARVEPPSAPPAEVAAPTLPASAAAAATTSLDSATLVLLASDGSSATVSRASGLVTSLSFPGLLPAAPDLLTSPLEPCFWRAPTDNDKGGAGGTSHAARWAAAGLDRLHVSSASVAEAPELAPAGGAAARATISLVPDPSRAPAAGVVGVGVGELGGTHWLADQEDRPSDRGGAEEGDNGGAEEETVGGGGRDAGEDGRPGRSPLASLTVIATYVLSSDASLAVRYAVDASRALPSGDLAGSPGSLPRVGARAALSLGRASCVPPAACYYGLGPHETYPDRQRSGVLSRHSVPSVADLSTPYIAPGENGGRGEVRWVALWDASSGGAASGDGGAGVGVPGPVTPAAALAVFAVGAADPGREREANDARPPAASFQMGLSVHSAEELAAASNYSDLARLGSHPPVFHLHVDAAMMGVGGDDSWSPSVLDRYLVRPGSFELAFEIAAVGVRGDPAEAVARAYARRLAQRAG